MVTAEDTLVVDTLEANSDTSAALVVVHFGFAHRRAFVHPVHRRVVVRRFPRHFVVVRRFPQRVVFARHFRRSAFFVGAPIYAYG